MRLGAHFRLLVTGLLLTFAVALAVPAFAQQVNPTADSVKEQQFLDALKGNTSAELTGRITIPDGKAATLERPAGREWRAFHQGTMIKVGAVAVLGTLLLLAVFPTAVFFGAPYSESVFLLLAVGAFYAARTDRWAWAGTCAAAAAATRSAGVLLMLPLVMLWWTSRALWE